MHDLSAPKLRPRWLKEDGVGGREAASAKGSLDPRSEGVFGHAAACVYAPAHIHEET